MVKKGYLKVSRKNKNKQNNEELAPELQRLAWKGVNVKRKRRRIQKNKQNRVNKERNG